MLNNSMRSDMRGQVRVGMIVGVVVALIAGFFLLKFLLKPPVTDEPGAVGGLVVDLTGSSQHGDVRELYRDVGEKSLAGLTKQRAVVTVDYFDNQGAKLSSAKGRAFNLYLKDTGTNEITPEEGREAEIDDATQALKNTLQASAGTGRASDIVTPITQAAQNLQTLAKSRKVKDKYLIVFTDGQQNTRDLNLMTASRSGTFDAQRLVKAADSQGRLADLAGITVYFVGVNRGVSGTKQLPVGLENDLEEFWTAYVEAGGGTLGGYQSQYKEMLGSQ